MKYAFYITNHGFGHASRNVPIIKKIAMIDSNAEFVIKSDDIRCDFLKKNFVNESIKITYYDNCMETGLILKDGTLVPDLERMNRIILDDMQNWDEYISKEIQFMKYWNPDIVIADVVCWAIKAAYESNIKTLLIGNFSWAQMYKSLYKDRAVWGRYEEYYKLADFAMWYQIHSPELHMYCENYEEVSLCARETNNDMVNIIKEEHSQPIIFVSLGASAEIEREINVNDLPYDFITTRGIKLMGNNVYELPLDIINTPDYIAASELVIAKGGWSTVSEILLQKKKSALFYRGHNSEDFYTKKLVEDIGNCVGINESDLLDMKLLIERVNSLSPDFSAYKNDSEYIAEKIIDMAEVKHD